MPQSLSYLIILLFICQSSSLNVLFVTDGAAGHVTTMYELAKAMKHHNITFLTQQLARSYIAFDTSSNFHLIYSNDSTEAIIHEKKIEQEIIEVYTNYSFIDSIIYSSPKGLSLMAGFLKKTIEILTVEKFDVIVINGILFWGPLLCDKVKTPCVIQGPVSVPNILNLNLPNYFALLTPTDMTKITTRLFNAIFTFRLFVSSMIKSIPMLYKTYHLMPRVPGPFNDCFTLKNLLSAKSKSLYLVSMPSTLYASTVEDAYTKYLGAFIDETIVDITENDLTRWIKSKETNSVIFAAFGSTSVVPSNRMSNLILGIAEFLIEQPNSSILLALRNVNYDTYKTALKEIENTQIHDLFNSERVKVEQGFVPQKWLLQQSSVKIFISHCGMGSILEALYFEKSILCMPFNMDQFSNAFAIDFRGVGLSLFVPNLSPLESLITPYDYRSYTFTPKNVQEKLSKLWSNITYQQAVKQISLEMKHAGGVKKAVAEIEFFVQLNGNFDRFIPFETTLPFYQRYLLDLLAIFVLLPVITIVFILGKCCRRRPKQKTD